MPRLLLLRHAKSDWGAPGLADRDRDLAPRGERDAGCIGRLLATAELVPDAVLVSPALRARRTAEVAAAAGGWKTVPRTAGALYDGDVDAAMAALRETAPDVEVLLVVGHEPRLPDLLAHLVGGAAVQLPTCGLARLDVPDWDRLDAGRAVLRWLVTPRLLAAVGA
jgi:phosphohistidine phosphatase